MSPKNCSLAFDEEKEVLGLEPELSLLVKSAMRSSFQYEAKEEIAKVEGRIVISF